MNGGLTIGHINNETYFIFGAIPGETVLAKYIKDNKKAKIVGTTSVINPSDSRINSDCEIFLSCGGCTYRHISYEEEIKLKSNLLKSELNVSADFIFHIASPLAYRNNAQIKTSGIQKGFYKFNSNEIIPLPANGCKNLPDQLNKYIKSFKADGKREIKIRLTDAGIIRYESNRSSFRIKGKLLTIPPNGFFQINRFLIDNWISEISSMIDFSNFDVLELFCGSGLLSLFIAEMCRSLTGYEMDRRAIESCIENANKNEIKNAKFLQRDIYMKSPDKADLESDAWVANPPRNGLGKVVLDNISKFLPKFIVYSSCNYITLAWDSKKILESGYEIKKISAFDFFPRTPYFETIVLFAR